MGRRALANAEDRIAEVFNHLREAVRRIRFGDLKPGIGGDDGVLLPIDQHGAGVNRRDHRVSGNHLAPPRQHMTGAEMQNGHAGGRLGNSPVRLSGRRSIRKRRSGDQFHDHGIKASNSILRIQDLVK